MDWDLSVNAPPATNPPEEDFMTPEETKQPAAGFGPCLYFGPAGQRCSQRATANGFCARHQPDSRFLRESGGIRPAAPLLSPKRVGVIFTILALLWPVLADIVRELIRFFR
ncbi:MAG: DUF5763 domain-containing protein [Candidatus Acidiferrales bacterium]